MVGHTRKFQYFCVRQQYHGLRSPHRPLSATEDGDQSRRMPYLSEAWTFWPRKEATGVADAMIKAHNHDYNMLKQALSPELDWFTDIHVRVDLGYLGIQADYRG